MMLRFQAAKAKPIFEAEKNTEQADEQQWVRVKQGGGQKRNLWWDAAFSIKVHDEQQCTKKNYVQQPDHQVKKNKLVKRYPFAAR